MRQLFTIVILIIGIVPAMADNFLPLEPEMYYAINGGSELSLPPVTPDTYIIVGGNAHANLGYNCTGFNPAISMSNTINDIENSVEGLKQTAIDSATAAVGSLPMYELEKIDPKLYNLIQNAMTGAQDAFNVSMKDCQQSLDEIKRGKSPYQDWFAISDSNGWLQHAQAAAEDQEVDINAAAADVTQKGPNYGIQWVHKDQPSGGSVGDQVPIKVIYDVAVAGYNIIVDPVRALDDQDAVSTTDHPEITTFWSKPDDAGKFATLVLGNVTITTTPDDASQNTAAGVGLVPILTSCPAIASTSRTCVKTLRDKLATLVASNMTPLPSDLEQVSANELMISPEIIEALRNLNPSTQALYINRMAQDIAIQNLIDEALMLRRILIAGSQAEVVQNLQPALDNVNASIARLNKDIENLLFEHRIRQEMTSSTMQMLLQKMGNNAAHAASQENAPSENAALQNGAVYKPTES